MTVIKSDLLLCTGFILIGGGILLLAVLLLDSPTSFFFIFPFFFVGDLGPTGILFIAVSIAMIGIFIWQMSRFVTPLEDNSSVLSPIPRDECFICKSVVPSDAEYCPKCGTRISENKENC